MQFVNKMLQRGLSHFGVRLARVPLCVEPVLPFDVLELALIKALQDEGEQFYFVQIGANDGELNDFLNQHIRRYHLRGCLVEPMPDVFERLKLNYADQPQLDFRNIMIGNQDGFGKLHRFAPDAPVPHEFYHGLARQDADYFRRRARDEGLISHVEELTCLMQTFDTFMASLPVRHVSMLYIDTEGSDDYIIKAALQAGIFPAIINDEWTEMSLERRCQLKLLLADHKYRFIDVGADTVCLLTSSEHS